MTGSHGPMLDRRLTYVVAVADTGSFTRAAERSSVSQSAITKSVGDLERELRYSIFYRTPRGASLTERGRDFVERARQLLEDARTLMEGGQDPFAGTIRIGVCPASSEWRLAEPLAALVGRYPNLRFEVLGSGLERLVQLLRSGGVDVAFGFEAAFEEWPDIKRERCGEVHGVLFVRRDHPLVSVRNLSRAALTTYRCVLPADTRPFSNVLREVYEAEGVNWQDHLLVTDNLNIMKRVVASSDAFALTSEEVTRTPAFNAQFERLRVKGLFQHMHLCCATRARWESSPAMKAFVNAMRDAARRNFAFVE